MVGDEMIENPKALIAQWVKELQLFWGASYDSEKSYLRHYGFDQDHAVACEDEQRDLRECMNILEALSLPEKATKSDLQKMAVDALNDRGPRSSRNLGDPSREVECAIAVVRESPEQSRYYTRFHPKSPIFRPDPL